MPIVLPEHHRLPERLRLPTHLVRGRELLRYRVQAWAGPTEVIAERCGRAGLEMPVVVLMVVVVVEVVVV